MAANVRVYFPDNVLLYNPKTSLLGLYTDINVQVAWGPKPHPIYTGLSYAFWDPEWWISIATNNPIVDKEGKFASEGVYNGTVRTQIQAENMRRDPASGESWSVGFTEGESLRLYFYFTMEEYKFDYNIEIKDFPLITNDTNVWYEIKNMPVTKLFGVGVVYCNVWVHIYVADNARNFKQDITGASSELNGSSLTFEFNYYFLN
jgi:hypothetical protein